MGKIIKLDLPPADDLFSTQEERDDLKREKIINVQLSLIDGFPGHPFRVAIDDEMMKLVDSVKAYGVQVPAILRQKEDGRYELVSGHRRLKASELAGLEVLPSIVRQMSRDEAVIAMVDSNIQRERVLPSEKAFAYKMKLDAMNRQGERTDLTCSQVGNKLIGKKTVEIIAFINHMEDFRY
jgi:ParB family chromosome partitioning protein